jgi:RHS repeat-associated protein
VLDGQSVDRELQGSTVHATYLHGARGPEYRRDSTGNVRWYLYDGLGSVLGEVDPSGTITASRKYDVYGGVRGSTGTGTSNHRFVGNLGHPSEDETGLIYMRARYYDPVTGRFASEDPAKDGTNWFAYASNRPCQNVDATGESSVEQLEFALLKILAGTTSGGTTMLGLLQAATALGLPAEARRVSISGLPGGEGAPHQPVPAKPTG